MKNILAGLTGPTGAGKSTVSELLREHGYTVIDCDVLARKAVEKGSPALERIAEVFGADTVLPDGTLDRKLLAKRAFSSREETEKLNAILHPVISDMVISGAEQAYNRGEHIVLADAAALFESGIYSRCDFCVSVVAPKEIRLRRIMARDRLTKEQAQERMSVQFDDGYYARRSDMIINNYPPFNLDEQVAELEKRLGSLWNIQKNHAAE